MRAETADRLWALVLAGGDGTRLQGLTRLISGAPIPKQYCRIAGDRSLLEATLARVAPLAPLGRTLVIVNRDHLALARPQLARLPADNLLVQPRNRDTGPGLVLSLLALARRHPEATVAVFPSDHHVRDEPIFRTHVTRAVRLIGALPAKIALLGVRPERADAGYGYIVPARPRVGGSLDVAAFCEKPSPAVAARIIRRGALWNAFVFVGRVARLLGLLRAMRPADVARLAERMDDARALAELYDRLPAWNFSRDFLARVPQHLLVTPADGIGWSDWGTREAIERTLAAIGVVPPWQAPARATA